MFRSLTICLTLCARNSVCERNRRCGQHLFDRIGARRRIKDFARAFDLVVIPPQVEREFGGKFDWLKVENLTNNLLVAALKMVVDAGEAEAIALASEKKYLLISDDKQARGSKTSWRTCHRNSWHLDSCQTTRSYFTNQTDLKRTRCKRVSHQPRFTRRSVKNCQRISKMMPDHYCNKENMFIS